MSIGVGQPVAGTGMVGSSLLALLGAQALSTFAHSLLRSALLTLVSFRGLTLAGLSPEAVVAISTLLVVLPYVVLSLPAGRLADLLPKASVLRAMLAFDLVALSLGALGLALGNTALLLLALLLAGIQAALMGPAKFAILPELAPGHALTASNGWTSASGTVAVLAGLILGNVLILDPAGFWIVTLGGVVVAAIAWWLGSLVGGEPARNPDLSLRPAALAEDYRGLLARLWDNPLIAWSVLGSSLFWFQGTVATALIPFYVAQSGQPVYFVSLLLLAISAGVALGSLSANPLIRRFRPLHLSLALVALIALPGLDFALMPHGAGVDTIIRVAFDMFVAAAGAGFYLVPLTAAIQQLAPADERARFVGISHTLSGLAMCCGGLAILVYPLLALSVTDTYLVITLVTALVAALCLLRILGTGRQAVAHAPV